MPMPVLAGTVVKIKKRRILLEDIYCLYALADSNECIQIRC